MPSPSILRIIILRNTKETSTLTLPLELERGGCQDQKKTYILVVEVHSYKRDLCKFSKDGEVQLPYSFPHQIMLGERTVKTFDDLKNQDENKNGVLGKVFNAAAPQKKPRLLCCYLTWGSVWDSNRPCCQSWNLIDNTLCVQDISDGDRAGHCPCARKTTVLQYFPGLLEDTVLPWPLGGIQCCYT